MSLTSVLADRHAVTSCKDPDTLHGILFSLETEDQRAAHQSVIDRMMPNRVLLAKARAGEVGRVPAFAGEELRAQRAMEFPDGLFPILWKREFIAAMLRPDGVTTLGLVELLDQSGMVRLNTANAMHELRRDMRTYRIDVESQCQSGKLYVYRIVGMSAWRMQKIIANGWSV